MWFGKVISFAALQKSGEVKKYQQLTFSGAYSCKTAMEIPGSVVISLLYAEGKQITFNRKNCLHISANFDHSV